jgi:hypothetical protein
MFTQITVIRALVVILALCGLWYAGWVFGHRILHDRKPIHDSSAEVAYCIANKMTASEKKTLAESLTRPSDSVLIGKLMPIILSGLPSDDKKHASRAIEERDRLHTRTKEITSRLANICRFDNLHRADRPDSMLPHVVAWLRYDEAFNAMLAEARKRTPDALSRLELAYAQKSSLLASLK